MADRVEERTVQSHGDHIHEEHIVRDLSAGRRSLAYRISSLVWVMFGLLTGAIALRFFLKLIGANPGSPFASLTYRLTDLFLWPFAGLTASPSVEGLVLEIPALFAILTYVLVGWALVEIIWLLLYRA